MNDRTPSQGQSEDRIRARRRLRDELRRIRMADSLPVAAHAALVRLRDHGHLLDWEEVLDSVLDVVDEAGGEPARWPGDVRAARAPAPAELSRWLEEDDVA